MAAGILALDVHMNLSSSTPRRLHRDDVERPRGNRRGGSVRVLLGGSCADGVSDIELVVPELTTLGSS